MGTFGKTDIGSEHISYFDGTVCFKAVAPEDGTLTKVTAYSRAQSGTAEIRGGPYSHDSENNKPDARLAVSGYVEIGETPAWHDLSCSYAILKDVIYWLAFGFKSGSMGWFYYDAGAQKTDYKYGVDMPDPYGASVNFMYYETSIYGTYAPAAPPGLATTKRYLTLTHMLRNRTPRLPTIDLQRMGLV